MLDEGVRRVLFAVFDSGLFDHPNNLSDDKGLVSTLANQQLTADVAASSMVMLKNDSRVLP